MMLLRIADLLNVSEHLPLIYGLLFSMPEFHVFTTEVNGRKRKERKWRQCTASKL